MISDISELFDCHSPGSIWGESPDSLFVDVGGLYYYDGTNWGIMEIDDTDTATYSQKLFGFSDEDVFSVGAFGSIYHCTPD